MSCFVLYVPFLISFVFPKNSFKSQALFKFSLDAMLH